MKSWGSGPPDFKLVLKSTCWARDFLCFQRLTWLLFVSVKKDIVGEMNGYSKLCNLHKKMNE